ncbi:FAD-linked oxidase C-terminal domain-containing protein [Candidatus Nitrosocosmicus sp. T]
MFEYRGTITAEHGNGISRTTFIKNIYNNFVYSYFSYLKKLLDPLNLLNLGKKPIIRSVNTCFFFKII